MSGCASTMWKGLPEGEETRRKASLRVSPPALLSGLLLANHQSLLSGLLLANHQNPFVRRAVDVILRDNCNGSWWFAFM